MKINVSTVYIYLPAKTSKWTKVDAFLVPFIYFLLFFSYTPIYLLLCNYLLFTKQPLLSAIMLFLPFFDPFFTLFCTFSHPFDPSQRKQISSHWDLVHRHMLRLNPVIPLPRGRADTPDPRSLLLYSSRFNLWATATLAQNGILGLRVSLLKKLKPFSYHPPTFKAWPPNAIIPCRIKK